MESSIYKKKISRGGELNALHNNILQIASSLRKKTRVFSMLNLFEECCKTLPHPESEIDRATRELYDRGFLVEGKQLFKQDILKNEKRANIYDYFLNNPGAHEREIRKALELGAYETNINLSLLTKFGFIRNKSYKNKIVYFPLEFPEDKEMESLMLKEKIPQKINDCIKEHTRLRLSEISEILGIPSTTVKYHLKELTDSGMLNKKQEDQVTFFTIPEGPMQKELPGVEAQQELLEVKREYDYVGGQIRFKIAVRNFTKMAIHNIGININPSDQFISDIPQQTIANLPPDTTRGIDFYLTPLTCGQSKVFGSVSFEDAFGKVYSISIQPKEISIKCPLVQPINATQTEVNEWIKNLKRGTSKIPYKNIPDMEAFRIGREQVTALDLNEVNVNSSQLWGLYSGQVKVTGNNMVVKLSIVNPNIVLDVWADDSKQTTGFLAYLANIINIALEVSYKMVRKTEEVTQKIIYLLKMSRVTDELFLCCKELKPINEITDRLSAFLQLLQESFPDNPLIQPIKIWNSKLQSMFEPSTIIETPISLDLESSVLEWLRKIYELFQYHMKIYRETFEDFSQVSDEFSTGLDMIKNRIEEHEKTYGFAIMSYILVLDKKSGLTIFERNLGDLKINPDLVGGFLHALQSFGIEISASETSMKTLTYENYQFQIEPGALIRAALILRGPPNSFLISRLKEFVKLFEEAFGEQIERFSGNMGAFKGANEIFDAILK